MATAIWIIRGGWALGVGALVWLLLVLFLPTHEVPCGPVILLALCVEPILPFPVLVAIGILTAIFVWRSMKSIVPKKPTNMIIGWTWIVAAVVAIEIFFLSGFSLFFLDEVLAPRMALVAGCLSLAASVVLAATYRRVFRSEG